MSSSHDHRHSAHGDVSSFEFKEQVRSRTNVVDLIAESVALKPLRGGTDYVGLCPFHEDRNPSFHVYPDRQSWRCWVCQEGGDCFSYVMKKDGLGFRDTLEFLATRANLELPKHFSRTSQEERESRLTLYTVLDWAKAEFRRCLRQDRDSETARKYLVDRGFSEETLERFQVGFHPEGWHWLLEKSRGRFPADKLIEAKLAGEKKETNSRYDYFRNRVLFPIHDERGRTVGFGGRILPGVEDGLGVKYWNSPESSIFAKSRLLYAFDLAREAIRQSGTVVVTEGYTDCMMAHQHGVENVVATLGTALTEQHVTTLKRFARQVVLIYDGDDAGRMAAERSVSRFLAQEVDLRILTLPDRLDLAEFVAEHGTDSLRQRIETAPEAWDYKLSAVIDQIGLGSVDARQRVLDELLTLVRQVPRLSGSTRESMIFAQIARRVGVNERTIRARLEELDASAPRFADSTKNVSFDADRSNPAIDVETLTKNFTLECELLQIVLADPTVIRHVREEVGPADFQNATLRFILESCCDLDDEELPPSYELLTSTIEEPDAKSVLAWLNEQTILRGTRERLAEDRELALTTHSETPSARPPLLPSILNRLQTRREQLQLQVQRGEFARRTDSHEMNSPPIGPPGEPTFDPASFSTSDRLPTTKPSSTPSSFTTETTPPPDSRPDPHQRPALDHESRRLLEEAMRIHQRRTRSTPSIPADAGSSPVDDAVSSPD